jgi:hypothetical protein
MIVTVEELIGLNLNFLGETILFEGIDCGLEVNQDWNNWIINFLMQLKALRQDINTPNENYYRIIKISTPGKTLCQRPFIVIELSSQITNGVIFHHVFNGFHLPGVLRPLNLGQY